MNKDLNPSTPGYLKKCLQGYFQKIETSLNEFTRQETLSEAASTRTLKTFDSFLKEMEFVYENPNPLVIDKAISYIEDGCKIQRYANSIPKEFRRPFSLRTKYVFSCDSIRSAIGYVYDGWWASWSSEFEKLYPPVFNYYFEGILREFNRLLTERYLRNYYLFNARGKSDSLPNFWDKPCVKYAPQRIKALKKFKEACIKAAGSRQS